VALLRIINVPGRRLGKERIAVLVKDTETKSRSLWESIQALLVGEIRFASNDKVAENALRGFVRTIAAARKTLASTEITNVAELIDYIRENVNYDDHLRKKFGPEADERIANLEELKTFSVEVERVTEENNLPDIGIVEAKEEEETALERFLGNIALMTDVRDAGEDKVASVGHYLRRAEVQITISTIHAAKGFKCFNLLTDRIGMACSIYSRSLSGIDTSFESRGYR
jgi:DNA helicase II / ATP-dependent DNA helicase PcrA